MDEHNIICKRRYMLNDFMYIVINKTNKNSKKKNLEFYRRYDKLISEYN
ncbi:MAG: hypothetical protein IPP08_03015 [Chlorobiota bacterium]|nr:hypothetical protein [Chlorobiota bacterium]QQS67157.1 MAG: hypothetical protein IPP08_03015 [Chlorobiota bacterium]